MRSTTCQLTADTVTTLVVMILAAMSLSPLIQAAVVVLATLIQAEATEALLHPRLRRQRGREALGTQQTSHT